MTENSEKRHTFQLFTNLGVLFFARDIASLLHRIDYIEKVGTERVCA